MPSLARREEWARNWPLPIVGMLGITGPAAYTYSSGIFMVEMTRDFGWSRTQFSSALTVQMLVGLAIVPLMGRMLDRFGPRRMALAGIVPFVLALSLLGTATGSPWQWWLLSAVLAVGNAFAMTPIWISGVARSFHAARGTALAVTLAGIGVATAIWPTIAVRYIEALGWRLTFPAIALTWAAVLLPLSFFFFRPAPVTAEASEGGAESLPPIGPVLRSPTFLGLLAAGGLFAFAQLAILSNFVPILRDQGLDLATAAGIAGIIGIFSIIGRLGTGFLLDFMPTRLLAVGAFLLLLPASALLIAAHGSQPLLMVSAAVLGLAAGSEMDVLTYVASRRFEPRIFGSVYALLMAGLAISASLGPLAAGKLFDVMGSYDGLLLLAFPLDLVAILAILFVLSGRGRLAIRPKQVA